MTSLLTWGMVSLGLGIVLAIAVNVVEALNDSFETGGGLLGAALIGAGIALVLAHLVGSRPTLAALCLFAMAGLIVLATALFVLLLGAALSSDGSDTGRVLEIWIAGPLMACVAIALVWAGVQQLTGRS